MNYYGQMLEKGLTYQKFVTQYYLDEFDMFFVDYSPKDQIKGENSIGFEIKYDMKMETTGNVWIETHERSDIIKPHFPSGILREDNTWIYIIGNYKIAYIFSKEQLKRRYLPIITDRKLNKMQTSYGFLLSILEADEEHLILKEINFLDVSKIRQNNYRKEYPEYDKLFC